MPRIKGRNTQATREAVLAAAEWAFAEYGFENATFSIIARQAGVTSSRPARSTARCARSA